MNLIDNGAKPKAHYKHSQKTLDAGHLHGGKMRTWGLKKGEGICSKEPYFRELRLEG